MLNNLLKDIFFDFQFWYDLNLWDENYESYSIIENGEIVSNICVYKTQILFNQKKYSALSVGAVATKKEYRGRGLSRTLMEQIIKKYDNVPMYLSANDSVVDFYPKFGFKRIYEKLPICECVINNAVIPKLHSNKFIKERYSIVGLMFYINFQALYFDIWSLLYLDTVTVVTINAITIKSSHLKSYISIVT